MRAWCVLGLMLVAGALGACTHVKGIVVDDVTGRSHPSAVFTVGRPDGIGVLQRNSADGNGRFDFQISPLDESALYVYDGSAEPSSTMKRIDRTEINDHMRVTLPRTHPGEDGFGTVR